MNMEFWGEIAPKLAFFILLGAGVFVALRRARDIEARRMTEKRDDRAR